MQLTREMILARKLGQDIIDIDDDGGTVKVRSLNRREAFAASEIDDKYERDLFIIATGLVEPTLTMDDVRAWGEEDSTGALEKVSRRIGQLSGMVEGAGKSGVSRSRRRS